jgi:hypothetical protein
VETTYSLRQQVSILRDMAQRREVEADLLAREPNADQQAIARRRTLAREFAAEADELEKRALDAEKAVPHGMVPQ